MTVDLDGPEPLYEQIATIFAGRIADGTYQPRRRIPSEADVVAEFGVSRPTARAAIEVLIERGLIVTVRGKGRYVTGPEPAPDDGPGE